MIRPQDADLETKTGVDHSRDQVTSKDLQPVWAPISSRVCEGRSVSERGRQSRTSAVIRHGVWAMEMTIHLAGIGHRLTGLKRREVLLVI